MLVQTLENRSMMSASGMLEAPANNLRPDASINVETNHGPDHTSPSIQPTIAPRPTTYVGHLEAREFKLQRTGPIDHRESPFCQALIGENPSQRPVALNPNTSNTQM